MTDRRTYGGVEAAQNEGYRGKKTALLEYLKMEDAWWAAPIVIILMTVIFSAMDALVLYTVFDKAMVQSQLMGVIMALGVAVILNVLPLLVAKFIHQAISRTRRYALTMAVISVVSFFLLFGATVYLRYEYRDMYGTTGATQLVNTVSDESEEEDTPVVDTGKADAIVLLLCLEPLVTSICNFALAYLSDDEVRKKKEFLEIQVQELQEAISDLEAAIETIDYDVEKEIWQDEKEMQIAMEEVASRCDILRSLARLYLAEYLANPSATTELSHELNHVNTGELV